jgi:hypothetical protein
MLKDRMAEEEDWKDGMNAFRSRTLESMVSLHEKLDDLIKRIEKLEKHTHKKHYKPTRKKTSV